MDCIMYAYRTDSAGDMVRYNNKTYTYANWRDMLSIFTKSEKSLATHFDHFLNLNDSKTTVIDDKEETPDPPAITGIWRFTKNRLYSPGYNPDDGAENPNLHTTNVMSSAPKTVTYNESDRFDIGEAIPADETFDNHIEVDNWYGSFSIKQISTDSYTYTFNYSGYWYSTETGYIWDEEPYYYTKSDGSTGYYEGSGHY